MTAVAVIERPTLDLSSPVKDPATLRAVIASTWGRVKSMLPEHMNEQRFAALVLAQASKDPKVFNCTGESILTAINQAASIGLEINSATGEAYLIPYGKTATLVPGYKGLVKLALRSREVSLIEARLVYQGEKDFAVYYGTDSRIEHQPDFTVKRAADTVAFAYAVAKMPQGAVTFEVMTREQLDLIRSRSAGKNSDPWTIHREEMYRKTVTRRLCKYLPMSPELAQAVELSDKFETEAPDASSPADKLNAATEDPKPCGTCGRTDGTHDPDKSCFADE